MRRTCIHGAAVAGAILFVGVVPLTRVQAQEQHPHLHVSSRWRECSFQLDPSLTSAAWRQFTSEAGLVVYFRPLADARPMGRGKFEISLLRWQTNIDDHDAAWNDTFVHPDSTHWLFEGEGLKFPGLSVRVGVTEKTDLGLYFTKNPGANYGVVGGQVQRNLVGGATGDWAVATRLSASTLFGPEDLDFAVVGWDLVGSRTIPLTRWVAVSPYAGVSTYLARAHEKSAVVDLKDEYEGASHAMVGADVRIVGVHLAAEYGIARVKSFSVKVGVGR